MLWLLVIGLVHAYFIWGGDILVPYALCGILDPLVGAPVLGPLAPGVRRSPLLAVGAALTVVHGLGWEADDARPSERRKLRS